MSNKMLINLLKWAIKNPMRKDFVKGLLGEESIVYRKFRNVYYQDTMVKREGISSGLNMVQPLNSEEMLERCLKNMTMEQMKIFMSLLEAEKIYH